MGFTRSLGIVSRSAEFPKSHKLKFLSSRCEQHDARLAAAWPRETKFQQHCFELLRRAYVDARYSRRCKISDAELAWLAERVMVLQDLVRTVCEEHLAALPATVERQLSLPASVN